MITEQQLANYDLEMDHLTQLATVAGYTDNMPFAGTATYTPAVKLGLMKFAVALCDDLNKGGTKLEIGDLSMERIIQHAVEQTGHVAVENILLTDMDAVLRASAKEVFFMRFASLVAKKPSSKLD